MKYIRGQIQTPHTLYPSISFSMLQAMRYSFCVTFMKCSRLLDVTQILDEGTSAAESSEPRAHTARALQASLCKVEDPFQGGDAGMRTYEHMHICTCAHIHMRTHTCGM